MSIVKGLPYGRRLRFGNFYVEKYTKSLSKSELRELRKSMKVRSGIDMQLDRGKLPYIRVSTISGNWSISWACTMTMYGILDELECENNELTTESIALMKNVVSMFYSDTTILGDKEYVEARMNALSSYLGRLSVAGDNSEAIVEEEKRKHEALSNLEEMSNE